MECIFECAAPHPPQAGFGGYSSSFLQKARAHPKGPPMQTAHSHLYGKKPLLDSQAKLLWNTFQGRQSVSLQSQEGLLPGCCRPPPEKIRLSASKRGSRVCKSSRLWRRSHLYLPPLVSTATTVVRPFTPKGPQNTDSATLQMVVKPLLQNATDPVPV